MPTFPFPPPRVEARVAATTLSWNLAVESASVSTAKSWRRYRGFHAGCNRPVPTIADGTRLPTADTK